MAKYHIFSQNGTSTLSSNSEVYFYGTTANDTFIIPDTKGLSGVSIYITNMQGNDTVAFRKDVTKFTGNFETSTSLTGDGSVIGAWTSASTAGLYGTGLIGNVPILTDITNGTTVKISAIGSSDAIQFSNLKVVTGAQTGAGLTVSSFSNYTSNIVASIVSATTDEQTYTVKLQFSGPVEYITENSLPDASKFKLHFEAGATDTDVIAKKAEKISNTEIILTFDINDKDGIGASSAPATLSTNLQDITVIYDTTNSTVVDAITYGGVADATLISANGKTLGSLTHNVNPNTYSGNLNSSAKVLLSAQSISDNFKVYFDSNANEDSNFNDPVTLNQKYSIINYAVGSGTDNIEFVDQDNSTTAPAYASDATGLPIEIADDEYDITLRLGSATLDANLSITLEDISQSYSFVSTLTGLASQLTSAKGTFSYSKSPVVTGHADTSSSVVYLSDDFNGQVVYVNRANQTLKDGYNATITPANAVIPTSGKLDASKLVDRLNYTGGAGTDTVIATAQDDIIAVSAASNTVYGGDGNDSVTAGGTAIVTDLGDGNDTIVASSITTGSTIVGGSGDDYITLGAATGNRIEITSSGDGNDKITFGAGTADTLAFTSPGDYSNMVITYLANSPDFLEVKDTTTTTTLSASFVSGYTSVLTASGTVNAVDVVLKASSTTVDISALTAGSGFTSGTDKLTVDATAQTGNVTVTGSVIATKIKTGSGNDSITAGAGVDTILSGTGDDTFAYLTANFVAGESIDGGIGTDTIKITDNTTGLTDALFANKTGIEKLQYTVAVADATKAVLGEKAQAAGIHIIDISVGASSIDLSGATGYVDGIDVSISGSTGNDTIVSGGAADYILASDGDDSISSGAGNDTIFGGIGVDSINSGSGNDYVDAGTGNDVVTVNGGSAVSVDGGTGNDTLTLASATTVVSATNIETIAGSGSADKITFTSGATVTIDGGVGADEVTLAGAANTISISDADGIKITGDTGSYADTITFTVATTATTVDGGGGNDSVILGNFANAISIKSVETITGGTGVDTITFVSTSAETATIIGDTGADIVNLANQVNTITINDATVSVTGGTNNDSITFITTATTGVTVNGAGGNDNVTLSASGSAASFTNVDTVTGSTGNDTITFTTATGTETTTIIGNGGTDTLILGNSTNNFRVDGITTITGGTGNDTITFTTLANNATITGSGGTDIIYLANIASNKITLATNAATVMGNALVDTIIGGAGDDYLSGADGDDDLTGGAGADTILGGNGDDDLTGGTGSDNLTGGSGIDTFIFSTDGSVAGTDLDLIYNFNIGTDSDVLDFGGTAVLLATEANGTTATSDVDTSVGGKITFAAADDTYAKQVTAVQADTELDAIGSVAFWENGSDTYVYYAGAATGDTDDQIIKLVGMTGLTTITVNGSGDITIA